MRILVVEDDPDLSRQMKAALGGAGYAVDTAADGEEGHYLGDTEPYDAVVLDLGLPLLDGAGVLKRWRKSGKTMPVLILTARDGWSEKVAGFDAGADDYVTKPFGVVELMARIGAHLRRASGDAGDGRGVLSDEALQERFGLTSRQIEVARLLAQGLSNAEIAERLALSTFTARNHTEQVLLKLGASTRARVGAILRGQA